MKEDLQFEYLIEIRKCGITNIIGASRELQERFGLSHQEAIKLINEWNHKYGFTN